MTNFSDLPDSDRMRFRFAIEDAGGLVESYAGECVQVAMPRDVADFLATMRAIGLDRVPGSGFYFPLGSDGPPDSLRHDGNYPGSRGFWHSIRLRPAMASVVA